VEVIRENAFRALVKKTTIRSTIGVTLYRSTSHNNNNIVRSSGLPFLQKAVMLHRKGTIESNVSRQWRNKQGNQNRDFTEFSVI